ncbi:unnamed protein product [Xylocopa violacea]|uniref:DUF4780 domain-containing protein n=1 Tax=Xylocopa violacea TaxID=135666 RepID=A0ABP1NRR7_XYLVO
MLVGTNMEFNEINQQCYNSTKKKKKKKNKAMTAGKPAEPIGNSSTMAWFPYEENLWDIDKTEDHIVTETTADFADTSNKRIHSGATSRKFWKARLNLQVNSKTMNTTSVTTDDSRKTWRENGWQGSSSGYQSVQTRETNTRHLKWNLRSAGPVLKQPKKRTQVDNHSPLQATSRTVIYNDKATDNSENAGNEQFSSNNQLLQTRESNGRGIIRTRSPDESVSAQSNAKKYKIYPAPIDLRAAIIGGRKMCIIPTTYPEISLTFKQAQKIEQALCEALDNIPKERPVPRFEGWRYEEGAISITCKDAAAKTWLREIVADIKPWEGASFTVYDGFPKIKRMATAIRGPIVETEVILERLKRQNPGLRTHLWKVFKRKEGTEVIHLVLGVDVLSYEKLKEADFVAFVGLSRALFREIQTGRTELHDTVRIDQTVAAVASVAVDETDEMSGMAKTTEAPKMLEADVTVETVAVVKSESAEINETKETFKTLESGTIAGMVIKVKPELIKTSVKPLKIIRASKGHKEDKISETVTESEAELSEMGIEPVEMTGITEMSRQVEPDTLVETVGKVKTELAEIDEMSKTIKPDSIAETVTKVKPELVETAIGSITTAGSVTMARIDGTAEMSKMLKLNTISETVAKVELKLEKTVVGPIEVSKTTEESTIHEADNVAETAAKVRQQLDETAVGLIGVVETLGTTGNTEESTALEIDTIAEVPAKIKPELAETIVETVETT